MHDIKWIRENPQAFDAGLARRGLPAQSQELIALDERRRAALADVVIDEWRQIVSIDSPVLELGVTTAIAQK